MLNSVETDKMTAISIATNIYEVNSIAAYDTATNSADTTAVHSIAASSIAANVMQSKITIINPYRSYSDVYLIYKCPLISVEVSCDQ